MNASAERVVDVSGAINSEVDLLFGDGIVDSQKRGLVVGPTPEREGAAREQKKRVIEMPAVPALRCHITQKMSALKCFKQNPKLRS